VTLLARRVEIAHQPLVDQLAIRTQLRRRHPDRHLPGRRHRRPKRLLDSAPMHPVTNRKRANRQILPLAVAPDLLEQLHS
jgi:hypothetical protein